MCGECPILFQCWASVEHGGPALKRHRVNASGLLENVSRPSKHETLTQCWTSVVDTGPTLYQHCVNARCDVLNIGSIIMLIVMRGQSFDDLPQLVTGRSPVNHS